MVAPLTLRARMGAALAAVALLALPSSALAATFKVDPAHEGACSNNECTTIGDAIAAASDGDVIEVSAGTYAESPNLDKPVELKGAGDKTRIVGSGTGDVLRLSVTGATVRNLFVQAPADAQSALTMVGGSLASGVFLQREGGTEPVVDVTGAGTARLEKAFLVQGSATGTGGIRSAAGGLELVDVLAISYKGPMVRLTAGVNNLFQRSTLVTLDKDANGVEVLSAADSSAKKKLVTDSTVMVGGSEKSGLHAQTLKEQLTPTSLAGSIDLLVRHSTVLGGKGIWAQADANHMATDTDKGDVKAQVFSSIVHGHSRAINSLGVPLLISDTTASVSFQTSYAVDSADAAVTGDGETFGTEAPYAMLRPGTFALRADSPLIDKGGSMDANESASDVEGQPRLVDGNNDGTAATDIGADEFNNLAPSATFGATNRAPKQNEVVGFIAFASKDPEAGVGGGITEYRWDFGDGTRQAGTAAAVGHSYARRGTYRVTLTTFDALGAATVSAPVTVVVGDGVAPAVSIAAPVAGKSYRLTPRVNKRTGRKGKAGQLGIFGGVSDEVGVQAVQFALVLTKRDATRKARRSQAGFCEHFDGRKFAKAECAKVQWLPAAITPAGNGWYTVTPKRLALPAGRYQVLVRAFDAAGNASGKPTVSAKTLVGFRVK